MLYESDAQRKTIFTSELNIFTFKIQCPSNYLLFPVYPHLKKLTRLFQSYLNMPVSVSQVCELFYFSSGSGFQHSGWFSPLWFCWHIYWITVQL